MPRLKDILIASVLFSGAGCASAPWTANRSDDVPTKTAPSGNTPRQFDCAGANQDSDGNTRKDCLPNDADGAARDTEAGGGGTLLRP